MRYLTRSFVTVCSFCSRPTVNQDANYSPSNVDASINMAGSSNVLNSSLPALSQRFQNAHLQSFARCPTAFPSVSASGSYLPAGAESALWSSNPAVNFNSDGTISSYVPLNPSPRNRASSSIAAGMPFSAAASLSASKCRLYYSRAVYHYYFYRTPSFWYMSTDLR